MAQRQAEVDALAERYSERIRESEERGTREVTNRFEEAAARSVAVMNMPISKLLPLAGSDLAVHATFETLLSSGLRLRDTDLLTRQRHIAEYLLFPGYHEKIVFAALSIDGTGARNYGELSLVFRDTMISARASVFEENCLIWMRARNPAFLDMDGPPPGLRATWSHRALLAVAKLAGQLHTSTTAEEFAGLLLRSGDSTLTDTLIEVHIYGPVTIRAIASVLARPNRDASRVLLKELEHHLATQGVSFGMRVPAHP